MNIQYQQQNFCSRNRVIRKADDIVRAVNEEYPRVSKSIVEGFHKSPQLEGVKDNLAYKTLRLRAAVSNGRFFALTPEDMVKILPNMVKRFKIGNCFESAELCAIGAKTNGINDFRIGTVLSSESGDLDHAIVLVNDKKPYIMDAWLGFADYVPNAIERYKKEFHMHFDTSNTTTEKLRIITKPSKSYEEAMLERIPETKLKQYFPNLVIDKKM